MRAGKKIPAQPAELLDLATASTIDPRPMPRTMVVVAHPDDEVLALGGRLSRHQESLFVQVTDGAPLDGKDCAACGFSSLEHYRNARKAELTKAFCIAGLCSPNRIQLNVSDQQATFQLDLLTAKLRSLIIIFRPEVIFTHPYEGGHPDHDACAFAIHHVVEALKIKDPPVILEAAFYHAGPTGIETNCFLIGKNTTCEITRVLNQEERQKKQQLLSCFLTQNNTLCYFRNDLEQYRIAPLYDFSLPPHEGELFYERYSWGLTGKQFRELVRAFCASEVIVCN
jgi:N-acetylglucosamine malate deacetylase 2